MLIISRKKGESIVVEGGVEICLLDIQGDRVRLGIEAPRRIKVLRKELVEAGKANLEAAVIPGKLRLADLKRALKTEEKG